MNNRNLTTVTPRSWLNAWAAILTLITVLLSICEPVMAAEGMRFIVRRPGPDPTSSQDDEFVATKIKWYPETGMMPVQMVMYRNVAGMTLPQDSGSTIAGGLNIGGGSLVQELFLPALTNATNEWNTVNADFKFATPIYSSFARTPQGLPPTVAGLDGINLVTFQDPDYPMPAPTVNSAVLAVTSMWFFNTHIDLSDPNTIPGTSISSLADNSLLVSLVTGDVAIRIQPGEYNAGTMLDADIIGNQELAPNWLVVPDNPDDMTRIYRAGLAGIFDIQAVLTHELGHVAGLAHTTTLARPTMTPFVVPGYDPYQYRNLDFDDRLSLRLQYTDDPFSRMGYGAIMGRIINGDSMDNVPPIPVQAIENTPVFAARPHDTGLPSNPDNDETTAIDQTTSFTRNMMLFAEVLNSPEFRAPAGATAPDFRDNRYIIPSLPASTQDLVVQQGSTDVGGLRLPPNDYGIYIQPGALTPVNPVQGAYPPDAALTPPEWYGGLLTPFALPGTFPVTDPNTLGDRLVQDTWLQFSYNLLGQFALRIAGSDFQLVDDNIEPNESYMTYRIVRGEGRTASTVDVPNFGAQNILPLDPVEPMHEDDINNMAWGSYLIDNALISTETIQLGPYRPGSDTTSSPSDMRVYVSVQNVTSETVSAGFRYLVKPTLGTENQLAFWLADGKVNKEETLTTGLPQTFYYAFDEGTSDTTRVKGVTFLSEAGTSTPDKLTFANFYNIAQFGSVRPVYFDYQAKTTRNIDDAAFAVQFDAHPLAPGEIRNYSVIVSFVRGIEYQDGPIAGPVTGNTPGEDIPDWYLPVQVTTGTITAGIDILTNVGTPGGLLAGRGVGDGGNPNDVDGDGVPNALDNCPGAFNPGQEDADANGVGDACDQNFVSFTDISPTALGNDRKDALPNNSYNTWGAAFGDIDNDGYPDLVIANGARTVQGPESLINRIYLNIAAPTASEPGARRFVDVTFGMDGIPGTIDDRIYPLHSDESCDIKLADFDNDGDLDMFVSNLWTEESGLMEGGQNRFYMNIDVDDPTINPSPDADSFGDGFFVEVTNDWDPGILNSGAGNPYINTVPMDSYGAGTFGFDRSTHSDVGDIDGDGDIDIVVSNQNCFMDIVASGGLNTGETPNSIPGLRFSERILINYTRQPVNSPLSKIPNHTKLFADETLGVDSVFGGLTANGACNDRLPPLKPEWASVTTTWGFGEVDLSNTNMVKLSTFTAAADQNDFFEQYMPNALSFIAFDMLNGTVAGEQNPLRSNRWDGDDLVYQNVDIDGDGYPDGVFRCANYGSEVGWLLADDGVPLRIGIPDGLPSDAISPESNIKSVVEDQTQAGVVLDFDFTGWNEVFAANTTGADHNMHTGATLSEFARGSHNEGFGSMATYDGIDISRGRGHPNGDERTTVKALPRTGRARSVVAEDFNMDGLPDIFIANDTDVVAGMDVWVPSAPLGHNTFHMNKDFLAFDTYHGSDTTNNPLITNDSFHAGFWAVAEDYDKDGDKDIFVANTGGVPSFYRNNYHKAGVAPTVPISNPSGNPLATYNAYDAPLFTDVTWETLSPYMSGSASYPNPAGYTGNVTLACALADMDRDGDLDLVFANGGIASTYGELQILYKNNGKALNQGMHVFTPAPTPYSAPVLVSDSLTPPFLSYQPSPATDVKFVDLNNDSGPDIIFTNNGQPPRIFMNVDVDDPTMNANPDTDSIPDGIFEEQAGRVPMMELYRKFSRRMAVGDVNGDGALDIVIANGVENEGAPNVILINHRGGTGGTELGYFADETDTRLPKEDYVSSGSTVIGPVLDDSTDVALVDVDNDGDLDLVFVNRGSTRLDPSPNFYPYCRLLLNDGHGYFSEVLPPGPWASRIHNENTSPTVVLDTTGRWPMAAEEINGQCVLVGDFCNRGEPTEDVNGNGIMWNTNPNERLTIEQTEDLNANGIVDYVDKNANGRHDCNYDLFIGTGDTSGSNILLMNQDVNGDGFGDGVFRDEITTRMAGATKWPTYGGDVGDVNLDGTMDLALAIDTQTAITGRSIVPAYKIPVQLFANVASSTVPEGGVFIDISAPSVTSSTICGELPVLKTQNPVDPTSQFAGFPGNSHNLKLADIDRDGDLDMIICQTGRVSGAGGPFGGWCNYVLQNQMIAENYNSRRVLSVRDPGGPILRAMTPQAVDQGQVVTITLFGQKFAGKPAVNFGAGITVIGIPQVLANGERLVVTVNVSPQAQLGSRTVVVTNPDGQYATARSFNVLPAGTTTVTDTAAHREWQLYE